MSIQTHAASIAEMSWSLKQNMIKLSNIWKLSSISVNWTRQDTKTLFIYEQMPSFIWAKLLKSESKTEVSFHMFLFTLQKRELQNEMARVRHNIDWLVKKRIAEVEQSRDYC